jgi:hypothetical protein
MSRLKPRMGNINGNTEEMTIGNIIALMLEMKKTLMAEIVAVSDVYNFHGVDLPTDLR